MSVTVKVPAVGESINEVTVANWLKKDGDFVEQDEIIAELESDKATFELPAEATGKLILKVSEGENVEVGAVLCEIDTEAQGGETKEPPKKETKKEETSPSANNGTPNKTGEVKEMIVPTVGESITEVTIASWIKQEGDYVELDEIIAEVDSDKATFELPAEASGILHIEAQEGDTLEIGSLICKIEITEGKPPASSKIDETTAPDSDRSAATKSKDQGTTATYASGHSSPAAAKILQEKGIDPGTIKGTGVDGRITKEDAEKATVQKKEQPPKPAAKETAPEGPQYQQGLSRNSRREKMSNLRKTIARRLVSVKNDTAMLTTFNEVNMKPVMDLRKKYKDQFKDKYGVGLGFMSFFTKACCMALKEWPAVNAMLDGDEMVFNDYCDVSIAVSTKRGLVVPVIRNAEAMDFQGIEKEIIRLAERARDGKLTIDEMTGGTFTITNGGVFGSMLSTPIINSPQSAILGMHNIVERPVVENGEIVVRPVMYVALSYDHRIVDGRESVSFLYRVKELLEDPGRLLLGI
jgi:2-oxoglutarate dehydrogenase E2 component (dihydrolipoamide succinyltransferase)